MIDFTTRGPYQKYSEELKAYRQGYALFDPQPDSTRQPPRPVEIGDVGYIKPVQGYFVRLFNIHLEPGSDGQPSRDQLPDHFQAVPKGEVRSTPKHGMHLFASETVSAPEVNVQVPAGPFFGGFAQFTATSKHGAILATPDPLILSMDAINDKDYDDYLKTNIRDLTQYLAQKVRSRVTIGALLLITGVDRTTSWANAVWSDASLKVGFGLEVQFAASAEVACRYAWRNSVGAITKFGPNSTTSNFSGASAMFPAHDIRADSRLSIAGQRETERHPLNSTLDQTIFIRYNRGKSNLWDKLPRRKEAATQPMDVEETAAVSDGDPVVLRSARTNGSNEDDGHMTTNDDADAPHEVNIVSSPEYEEFSDHLDIVLDHILKRSGADMAIASHKDLRALEDDPTLTDIFRCVVENGIGMILTTNTFTRAVSSSLTEDAEMTYVASPTAFGSDIDTEVNTSEPSSPKAIASELTASQAPSSAQADGGLSLRRSAPLINAPRDTSDGLADTNEYLREGYLALSFGPADAVKLFNKFVGIKDFSRPPGGIKKFQDATYRFGGRTDVVLDYTRDLKGTIVSQSMWQPLQTGDVHRHFRDATLLFPVFFISLDFTIGVDLAHVSNVRPGTTMNIFHANAPAPLGNMATTHLCIKWPGYAQNFRKQVEIQDANRAPITMSKLVERICSFVSRFIEEASNWPIDIRSAHWRVGRGFITKESLYVVGLVHVSAGCWQPIIQLKGVHYI
ncbi:unnamed protein product [Peniophora sp. CBMAI 1063]|nr:unnamed protein product [Peniophora sp. CBMAI 1063]